MRHQGKITSWNDERGFGFVLPDDGSERVFLHIKSFEGNRRRPVGEERVTYEIRRDERNRLQAACVQYADVNHRQAPFAVTHEQSQIRGETVPAALTALGFLVFAAVMGLMGKIPVWVPCVYAGVSLITFGEYSADKEKAVRKQWRTPESTLHFLELAGGWPGALVAQQVLRHKYQKISFQVVFWAIVAAHAVLWVWMLTQNPFARIL